MAEQETLHNGAPVWKPELHGIWKRFIEAGEANGTYLDQGAINRARSGGEVVGDCRNCGGDLLVLPTQDPMKSGSSVGWTDFRCNNCGKETASPNLKRLHRSSAHSHMPSGWWSTRMKDVKARSVLKPF